MPDILHRLSVETPRKKVYAAVTRQDGLRAWFTRYAMAEPTIGYVNRFGFAGEVRFEMRVDDLLPDSHVQWTCVGGHPEWENTVVTFDLEHDPIRKKTTVLTFAQRGWKSTEGYFANCNYDWAQFLRSLKMYLERGKGTPA